ncbi:MAG: hypothetical protein PWP23_545 [Candidatus Sumerlaeota bacterium]|nr:hypothetical protein [Candidatus Sumerlaeota bacterium]
MKHERGQKETRRRTPRETAPPAPLHIGALALILAAGAVAAALGVVIVDARFEARDLEIETRRIQELSSERRGDIRALEAQIGQLKRGESLRQAALGPLGMIEPAPAVVDRMDVSEERAESIRRASQKARQLLVEKRAERESWKKEVF